MTVQQVSEVRFSFLPSPSSLLQLTSLSAELRLHPRSPSSSPLPLRVLHRHSRR